MSTTLFKEEITWDKIKKNLEKRHLVSIKEDSGRESIYRVLDASEKIFYVETLEEVDVFVETKNIRFIKFLDDTDSFHEMQKLANTIRNLEYKVAA